MDQRCASEAFFSAFRAWQIACQNRHLHGAHSTRRQATSRRSHTTSILCKIPNSQQRWKSTQPKLRKISSDTRSANKEGLKNVRERTSYRQSISETLSGKYPELELDEFMQKLEDYMDESTPYPSKHKVHGAGALKSLMRVMPHSTVLITTLADQPVRLDASLKDSKKLSPYSKHFRGAIVSSMTSVTLGPPAIISFNFKEPSATLNGIRANQLFSVHFMKADAQGARIAQCFLKHPGDHFAAWAAVSQNHETTVSATLDFDKTSTTTTLIPACPLIKGPGVAANLTCKILPDKCVTGIGDHSIIVAEVVHHPLAFEDHDTMLRSRAKGYPPLLLYSDGQFRKHGEAIGDQVSKDSPDNTAVARHRRGRTHPDMQLKKYLVSAKNPPLYQAASSYIDEIFDKAKASKEPRPLRRFIETMNQSDDKRAKFLSALVLWRYEREWKHAVDRSELDAFLHRAQTVPETIMLDSRFREITEKLAELSARQTMGETATNAIAKEFRKGTATTSEALHSSRVGRHPAIRRIVLPNHAHTESDSTSSLGRDKSVEEALIRAKAELESFDFLQSRVTVRESQDQQDVRSDLMIDSIVEGKAFAADEKTVEQSPAY